MSGILAMKILILVIFCYGAIWLMLEVFFNRLVKLLLEIENRKTHSFLKLMKEQER